MDKMRVQQILLNLLSNAVKFSLTFDVIKVMVDSKIIDAETRSLEIKVRDYGIGMNSSDLGKLFTTNFKTTDQKSKEMNTNSHGLGLSICKKISNALGGDISV